MQVVIRTYFGKGTKKLFDLLEHPKPRCKTSCAPAKAW